MRNKLFLLVSLVVAVVLGSSIFQTEAGLRKAETVYFKMAPVDPRALMMGDYMIVNYAFEPGRWVKDRQDITLYINEAGEAATQEPGRPLIIKFNGSRYRIPHQYYFQEGTAAKYENAQYAVMAVLNNNKLLIKALADADKQVIR